MKLTDFTPILAMVILSAVFITAAAYAIGGADPAAPVVSSTIDYGNHFYGQRTISPGNSAEITVDPGRAFQLHRIDVHTSSAAAGSLTVYRDATSIFHDTLIHTEDLTGDTNAVITFDPPWEACNRDVIKIFWSNDTAVNWGIEALYWEYP